MGSKLPAKTLNSFREKFDRSVVVPNKIKAALQSLLDEHGPEAWESEGEIIKRSGISMTDMGEFREMFEKHIVKVRERNRDERRIWFGDAKVAAKVRAS